MDVDLRSELAARLTMMEEFAHADARRNERKRNFAARLMELPTPMVGDMSVKNCSDTRVKKATKARKRRDEKRAKALRYLLYRTAMKSMRVWKEMTAIKSIAIKTLKAIKAENDDIRRTQQLGQSAFVKEYCDLTK
jgi:hypothetical protein